ncbi:MAG: cytochrome c3 family protein, partial [Anaerolineae bacterium]
WVMIGILAALFLLGGLYALIGPTAQAQPPQPQPLRLGSGQAFSHQKHVEAGTQCVFCHAGVLNGAVAGLPSVAKCMGCHQNVQVSDEQDQPDVDMLVRMWEEGRPLRWAKVNDQPDFVYFSHRPHVANGVSCEACHGDVSHMDIARPVYNVNMGFCLDCHRQQAPEKASALKGFQARRVERLVDCKTCHK